MSRVRWRSGLAAGLRFAVIALLLALSTPWLCARSDADFDEYKVRIDAFWFYSNPTATLQDATSGNIINLHKDFAFSSWLPGWVGSQPLAEVRAATSDLLTMLSNGALTPRTSDG